ncbi:hypothetical protein MNEG_4113 [Monoraphidium neglectum]|uniref:Uncharacterized protein n=1 Tax=Monoraphidium neglectum TaxID=145388 RepID=A0A0D2MTQ0_9CHLO|nr:hypothetical protein MNEG_4113 [Monoraphidium neglectum]KIZ03847.1 hypothetical protein MNEG_4113 [Monoraphidium neglectum]|eukprot:XP_013902866.1 hypothetical protein MNEG_4113 [Monoraphidium neglectum]
MRAAGDIGKYCEGMMEQGYRPAKADKDLDEEEVDAMAIKTYIHRWAKLLLLEADEGVLQHVQALKDWPLELLSAEGWVLLDMEASRAGKYHDMRQVKFSIKDGEELPRTAFG